MMQKIFNDLLTGRDNETHDIGRHSWIVSIVGLFGLTIWNLLHGVTVSLVDFAEGLGVICGAHGAAIGFKGRTEPESTPARPINYQAEQ